MATDTEFTGGRGLWWRRLKGRLFVGLLLAATSFGILALAGIFLLIGFDAIGPTAAEPAWYLVYLGTLVGPVAAFTLYCRRRPATRLVNARAHAVVVGTVAVSCAAFAVIDAVSPYDVIGPLVLAVGPPLVVLGHARRYGESHLTGPAVPVSVVVGLGVALALGGVVRPVVAVLAEWVAFLGVVTVPVAGLLGPVVARVRSHRAGLLAAATVALAGIAGGVAGVVLGSNASLLVVFGSVVVAPVGVFAADTLTTRDEGRVGLLGPIVLAGGVLLGAWIETNYGIAGVDSWITPTLLLDGWSDFRPQQAGVYPQVVGSVMIVAIMAVLSFPVGVGAAIYLEEYAPTTGWQGWLASLLDVNISNLAGVPSVVYGLLGLALFRQVFGLSPGIAVAAGATLGLLILPIVIVSAQEALRAVPDELRQGSYGLGASRWQTVRNVVLPEALPGILTGTILALGRAIGETAPLVMIGVATTRFSPPEGLFSGTTALPLQIFAAKGNNIPAYRTGVVAATALVLLFLLLALNATAILIRNRYQRDQ